ncbi:MAG: hypothetical protein M1603_00600 [Candidatus Marsarchaeota archaeon]|nr:hypothetical protein [Candidatus Marsarchaeota archaeon]
MKGGWTTLADEIEVIFKDFKTFTFNDARMVLRYRHKSISDKTIQVTLSRMAARKRIYQLTKGVYSLEKRDEIAGFAFAPFYYGGLAALMIRDMIDDQVKMEIMTTHRVKASFIAVFGGSSTIVLHHIQRKYYFGFEDLKYGDITVPVSDPEKTLIDLFYYRVKIAIQDYSELLRAVNTKKLARYLKVYNKRTASMVMEFVKEHKEPADSGKLENPY